MQVHYALVDEELICGNADMTDDEAMELVGEVNDAIDLNDKGDVAEGGLTRARFLIVKAQARLYPLPCE